MYVCVLVCVQRRTMGLYKIVIEIQFSNLATLFLKAKYCFKQSPYWGWGRAHWDPRLHGKWFLVLKSWKLTFKGESYMCATWLGKMTEFSWVVSSLISVYSKGANEEGGFEVWKGSILHSWRCPGVSTAVTVPKPLANTGIGVLLGEWASA